jgi:hypothetical protein
VSYERVGDVLRAQRNRADALTSYRASLAVVEHLANTDPGNLVWQTALVPTLLRISLVSTIADARAALERALAIAESLARDGKLTAEQRSWPQLLRDLLAKLPK